LSDDFIVVPFIGHNLLPQGGRVGLKKIVSMHIGNHPTAITQLFMQLSGGPSGVPYEKPDISRFNQLRGDQEFEFTKVPSQ